MTLDSCKGHNIIYLWLRWYIVDIPKGILRAFWNFLKFYFYYFSIIPLLKTLFAPWRRYRWSYGRGFDLKQYLSTAISNGISRLLGALMRVVVIVVGLVFEVFIIVAGLVVFCGWFLLPFLLVLFFYFGFVFLF